VADWQYVFECRSATDSYAPSEMTSSRGGGVAARTPSARRTEAMTSSVAERSNTLPRTAGHVTTSPLPAHRQSSASNTPPSVSPKQSPTWRRKTFTAEREVRDDHALFISLITAHDTV